MAYTLQAMKKSIQDWEQRYLTLEQRFLESEKRCTQLLEKINLLEAEILSLREKLIPFIKNNV